MQTVAHVSESIAGETETIVERSVTILQLTKNLVLLIKHAFCFAQSIVSVIATMADEKKTIVQTSETTVTVAQTARQSAVIFTVCRSAPGRLIQPGCGEAAVFSRDVKKIGSASELLRRGVVH
jgi:hypothetical protein